LGHVRERIIHPLLALSFDFHMRMRRHYYRAGLRYRGPEWRRRRFSSAHHNFNIVVEHYWGGGYNYLENKQAGRLSGRIWRHYQLW
jgi:hypothetical protein